MKYQRGLYPHWGKSPVKGFKDVRHYVISLAVVRDLEVRRGRVTGGLWYCAYTGRLYDIKHETPDMEHIWSLKYVHEHGGHKASKEQRELIANDPINLISVHKSSNRKKSWKVGEFLPINGGFWLEYLSRIKTVKEKYRWLEVSDNALERFKAVEDKAHEIRNGFFIEKQKNWFQKLWLK